MHSDPAQRHLLELAPIATLWLLENLRSGIGERAAPLDLLQLLEQLLLVDRLRPRIDRIRLLRDGRRSERHGQAKHQCGDEKSERCARRHSLVSLVTCLPFGIGDRGDGLVPIASPDLS